MPKWNKETYTISRGTLKLVKEALSENWFIRGSDGEEYNNDDVITADTELNLEIIHQEERTNKS